MKIIDISWPISSHMTTYKNRGDVSICPTRVFEQSGVRESSIQINSHTGTHIDAPAHFLPAGAFINELPLESFIGPCSILDLTHKKSVITASDLKLHTIPENYAVLFKTTNSNLPSTAPFLPSFVYLDPSGANYLLEHSVKLVGIDYLSIERDNPAHTTHKLLLSRNIPILEGLRLSGVNPGVYTLICLPLAFIHLDAAPARAFLIDGLRPL
jgi:arylformamidase